jgi:hypothetical protein
MSQENVETFKRAAPDANSATKAAAAVFTTRWVLGQPTSQIAPSRTSTGNLLAVWRRSSP